MSVEYARAGSAVARGIALAFSAATPRTPRSELANVEEDDEELEPLPPRKDGLRPLRPQPPKSAGQAASAGSRMVQGIGDGMFSAFVDPPKTPEEGFFTVTKGQKWFETAAQVASYELADEMCFVCDWYKEPWPLENKDGSATCAFLSSLPLKVELELPTGAMPKENVLVFGDHRGLCRRILAEAPKYRVDQITYVSKEPWDITADHIKDLLQMKKWDLVVYGFGLDFPVSNAVGDIMEHLDDVSRVYLELARAVQSARKNCKRVACITREVFTEDPKKHKKVGVRLATSSTLWGMSNCIRAEWEDIPLHYLDIELNPDDECISKAASELFCMETFGRNSVRVLNSGRYVMRQVASKAYRVDDRPFQLPAEGIIAITGGNGSLAQVFAKHILELAERRNKENPDLPPTRVDLRLLSRSGVVRDREMSAWLEVVEKAKALGINVEHAKCDVGNQASVERFVADCTPNLVGVVHTAGILQDAMLQGQTWEKMEVCLGCKSRAALYLHDALEMHSNSGLSFFWVFSTNSVYGNAGQVNYAGANFYLDGLMRHRVAMGKPGVAMQWGAWGEAGMAAAMSEMMKQGIRMSHMPFFSNHEGFAGMYAGISTGIPSICVEKFNPALAIGMKAQADALAQRFDRNFTSEMFPTPPPNGKTIKGKDMYDLYRMYCTLVGATGENLKPSGLVWKAYCEPKQRQAQEEEDEVLW